MTFAVGGRKEGTPKEDDSSVSCKSVTVTQGGKESKNLNILLMSYVNVPLEELLKGTCKCPHTKRKERCCAISRVSGARGVDDCHGIIGRIRANPREI